MKNNITAVIIDDERKGRMALRQKISLYCPEIVLVGEAENGIEGVQLILHHSPSIVFLDIEMPQMDGFEMIESLPAMDFHLIFTTAYDHYAIKAIRYAAFDYLLKPIDIEELKSTVRRAREQSWEETQKKWEVLHTNLAVPTLSGKSQSQPNRVIPLSIFPKSCIWKRIATIPISMYMIRKNIWLAEL